MKVYSYLYSTDYSPSMPVVDIIVNRLGDTSNQATLVALVDSGADVTMIPLTILRRIRAQYIGEARLKGVLERSQFVELYLVQISIGPHQIRGLRVAAVPGDETILGRDILNRYEITLNGLANTVEIRE